MVQEHQTPDTKILDVQQRTPGGRFAFTALAAGSYTKALHPATTYPGDVFDLGDWEFLQIIQDIYATSVTGAGDTLDVSIEFSTDGTNWFKAGQFTQQAGNGVARQEVMTFMPGVAVDPDAVFPMVAAAAVLDEKFYGRYMRVGVGVADDGADGVHQFKVTAYIK